MFRFVPILLVACAARLVSAQGGPPMITDDPGTPGNGKWENNFAITFEHRNGETLYELPEIDLNYGVGDRVQLTLQTAPELLQRSQRGPVAGLGGTEVAVKWRFLDEQTSGFDVSTFPRLLFNLTPSSVRRGLADDGTRFQLPFEVSRQFDRWHADAEAGFVIGTIGRSEWLYGVVGGYDVTKHTMVMAELHGSSRTNFREDDLILNFGQHHELTASCSLIVSLGHELIAPNDLALVGYFGMQFVY